ncbi:MAG TPA: fumarylacetoacetate hydrolase family protein [Burkholderiales bacterium]|jgi:2-keto-4-pentenoate hydratase/2-oxohepta-3-ene-1,7-dioic acid hydratase in catechol pathway|nr:fumarylacetoacetate hydrolase family protein [Burkholderiales bacterium]
MRICHYNDHQVGAVVGDRVHPLGDTLIKAGHLKPGYTMLEVIERLANDSAAMKCARFALQSSSSLPLASVKLLAPLLNPPAIWAAAANYKDHQAEMREKMGSSDRSELTKDELMAEFFLKPVSSIVGPGGPVVLPKVSRDVDFECELCAVIGRPARHVAEDRALEHVFGYTILWDFSQRDPWGRGRNNTRNIRKGFDTFTGLGPWIVTRDEIDDPQTLAIRVEQNGRLAMSAHTSDMICTLREHIRFLSGVATLASGVLITTGTPAGVKKLAAGDVLKGSIERIGEMEVAVQAERQ